MSIRTTYAPSQTPDPLIDLQSSSLMQSTDGSIAEPIEQSRYLPSSTSINQALSSPPRASVPTIHPPPVKSRQASTNVPVSTIPVPSVIAVDSGVLSINSQSAPSGSRIIPGIRDVLYSTGENSVHGSQAYPIPGPTPSSIPRGKRLGMGARGTTGSSRRIRNTEVKQPSNLPII